MLDLEGWIFIRICLSLNSFYSYESNDSVVSYLISRFAPSKLPKPSPRLVETKATRTSLIKSSSKILSSMHLILLSVF